MPEGDTIHRLAKRLTGVLTGQVLTAASGRQQGPLGVVVGERVSAVRAIGKNLIIELSGGWSFRVHLGVAGRCHVYEGRSRGRQPSASTTLVIETAGRQVVFMRAPQGVLLRTAHLRATPALRSLGPDLLAPECDLDEVLRRARSLGAGRAIGELLLDQRVAAGIGNVYRCEVLFMRRLDPWLPSAEVDEVGLREAFALSRELMQRNLDEGARVTVPDEVHRQGRGPRFWVYRRSGRPCLVCGQAIANRRQGEQARSTYHCVRCQGEGGQLRYTPIG